MKRLLLGLFIVLMLAAFCVPTAFCYAEADVARFHEILAELAEVDNYAIVDVFYLLDEADKILALEGAKDLIDEESQAQLALYHTYYTRDCCLVELDRRVGTGQEGDRTFIVGESTRTYLAREWAQIEQRVSAYREGAASWDEQTLRANINALYDFVRSLPTETEVYRARNERVNKVVSAHNQALFRRVDEMREALSLAPSVHVSFNCAENDCVALWDEYVHTYTVDYDQLVEFWHRAVTSTMACDLYAAEADVEACWVGYDEALATLGGIAVSGEDAGMLAAKEALWEYVQNALSSPPISTMSAEDKQLYLELADQCQIALSTAETYYDVMQLDSYYRSRFVVPVATPKKNTQWVWGVVSLAIALVMFAVYFVIKRRNPTPKERTTHKTAEQMMAELRELSEQKAEERALQAGEQSPSTEEQSAQAATPTQQDETPKSEDETEQSSAFDSAKEAQDD